MARAEFEAIVQKASELGFVFGRDSTFSIEDYKGTVNPCLETEPPLLADREYFVAMFMPPQGTLGGGLCTVIDRVDRAIISKILG